MMDKRSNENKLCTYCTKEALPNTDPPVCEDHENTKQASAEPTTLKELEAKDD